MNFEILSKKSKMYFDILMIIEKYDINLYLKIII